MLYEFIYSIKFFRNYLNLLFFVAVFGLLLLLNLLLVLLDYGWTVMKLFGLDCLGLLAHGRLLIYRSFFFIVILSLFVKDKYVITMNFFY